MSKKNFFVLLLSTACFVLAIANIAEAGKPFCGDGICKQNKENSCNCLFDCGPPSTIEGNCSDGIDNDCNGYIDCDDQDCVAECDLSPFCGDLECNGDETCSSCEVDCGVCPPVSELQLSAEQPAAHGRDAVRAVGFGTDGAEGTWIVSGGEDDHLRYWNLQLDDQSLRDLPLNHTIYDLDVDGSIVVTGEGGWNGHANSDTLRISDAEVLFEGTQAPIGFVYCVAISPDNSWTVASGFYGDIVVYDTYNLDLEPYATKATKKHRTKALDFSPDGGVLASTSTAGRIQL